MLIHREALEIARNAGDEDDRYLLSHVSVAPNGAVTATDGTHWLRMKGAVDEPNLFDGIAEKGNEELNEPVLIPADVMLAFAAAMKKRKAKKGAPVPHVVVARKKNKITLASSDGKTVRTFNIEADTTDLKFPDVDRISTHKKAKRSIVLSVDLLLTLLRTLRACKADSVKFGIPDGDDAPLAVSAFTLFGPIEGGIMPMREQVEP